MASSIIYIHPEGKGIRVFLEYYAAEFLPMHPVHTYTFIEAGLVGENLPLGEPAIILLDEKVSTAQDELPSIVKRFIQAYTLAPVVIVSDSENNTGIQHNGYHLYKSLEEPERFFNALCNYIELYNPLPAPAAIQQIIYAVDIIGEQNEPNTSFVFTNKSPWKAREAALKCYKETPKCLTLKLMGFYEAININLINYYVPDVLLRLSSVVLFQREMLPARLAEYNLYKAWGVLKEEYVEEIFVDFLDRRVRGLKGLD